MDSTKQNIGVHKPIRISFNSSNGAVLFISLIILLVLTILGLSAMQNSMTELKSTSNIQEIEIAQQAAQAGIDAVMCLADIDRTATANNNPFLNADIEIKSADKKYNWGWDKKNNIENASPFKGVTQSKCSVKSGVVSIGTIGSSTKAVGDDLKMAIRKVNKCTSCPRSSQGGDLNCQLYIIDSRYNFPASGSKSYIWSGAARQVLCTP